ncbi:MAG: hypothetical protein GY765_31690, partial [bacterium]|nr:hypothetical protein [bacterium]
SWNNSGSYAKYYTFTGAAYETVTIDLESAEDTYMYLVDSTGNILAQNDDGGNGLNSRITHQLPASGSYTIEATNRSYAQTGSFTVSLTCYSQSCTSSLACGDTISGDWEAGCMSLNRSGSYAKYYTFTGVAGTTVTIDLKSSLDTYLVLLDSNGNTLFTDDDGGIDANSQIIFALSESGTYTVEATTYRSGQTGSFTVDLSCVSPQIALNRSRISFGVSQYGWSSQSVFVDNSGGGQLNWTAGVDQAWLSLGTLSGTGPGEISVSVYADSLSAGTYTGTVTVADSSASNLSQTVTVYLTVYGNGRTSAPFGDFLTPEDGASVSSSVPFTGWVLDDLEVSSVQIYSGSTYIGDAVFVDGARPDLEAAYPDYPKNYQAGWGYMMLTNFLPGGGNGVYTISAIATDYEGNQTTLGTKTITVDNTNVVKPFGSIDTPTQGGVAYGTNFRHQGWVLTPLPNTIPVNGKTINVYIDSEYVGHPSYNSSRQDIAGFFPTNNNSSGAGAYMDINTTTYANGTHSIFWVVTDNGGNVDGIGSRFFTIQNSGYYRKSDTAKTAKASKADFRGTPFDTVPILTKVGFGDNPAFTPLASQDETHTVTMRETGKVQLKFQQAEIVGGYMLSGAGQIAMPIGSSIRGGVFSWIPTPGFIGDYQMQFLVKGKNGDLSRSNVVLRILPKFPLKEK